MELYEALQNGVDKQKLIDDFVAQLHEAETRVEREKKAKAEAEEKARKEKELAAQKMKDTAALEEAYKELEAASNKYWNLYTKVHPTNSWLAELLSPFLYKQNKDEVDKLKANTYKVKYPTQSDEDIIRKFINSL